MVANALKTIARRFGTNTMMSRCCIGDLVYFLCEENGIYVADKCYKTLKSLSYRVSSFQTRTLDGTLLQDTTFVANQASNEAMSIVFLSAPRKH
jgi:hypothetical protein